MYALLKINILEISEIKNKRCTDFDTSSGAKNALHLLLGIVQTRQLASTRDLLVNDDSDS